LSFREINPGLLVGRTVVAGEAYENEPLHMVPIVVRKCKSLTNAVGLVINDSLFMDLSTYLKILDGNYINGEWRL